MYTNFILIFYFGISIYDVRASSLDDLKMVYKNVIKECVGDYPITAADLKLIKARQIPNDDIKCVFACAYKKTGMMTEEGMLSVEGIKDMSQKYLSDNPEQLRKSKEFAEACSSVNDQQVSDGTKGCERAALIFKCSTEKITNVMTAMRTPRRTVAADASSHPPGVGVVSTPSGRPHHREETPGFGFEL
ncbi:odorant-binding protein 5 precursor [Bombyx mori]|uniref:Odorant-binding protein 5 n=1 Tax=Bombyx mori TaxID=7091 RepID=B8ZWK5_BOMMO|nr:odorant-binding protein 5 precursor [Bombyx mori]CAS90129.1 odorant-binding protein 5 precursor [Bombyx mori]